MKSPYLDLRDVAEKFRIRDKDGNISPRNALQWLIAAKVPMKKRGRSILVHEDDVEAALTVRG